ncbi:MAG TPA: HlyD family efflux transporter periplasmic adaptor subunit [Kofleriaceae bacterium]|nr:HlyD family efflux transporter periplasmic adaptor subunit [Kofleriaceae bacterium]
MIADTSGQDRPLTQAAVGRRWRWLPRLALAVGALGAIGYLALGWLGAERSVDRARLRIARVERGTIVRDVVADGQVVAANSPTLYAVAGGTVDFAVRPGDRVERGQRLATIASPELQSKLTQEQATLAALEAGVGRARLDIAHGQANAQKGIAQAEIDRQTAARDVQINQTMFDRGVIAELELRHSEDLLKKAEVALRHARIEAGLAGQELAFEAGTRAQTRDRQRAVVAELARQVAALDITSPVDGQVGQLLVAQRAQVAANAPVMTVVDLGAFELEISVPDTLARDLSLGMTAEVGAGAATFAARVRSVSPEVVNGNVATRLELLAPRPAGLRQNQRLTARILLEERRGVLKIARGPFVEAGGGHSAYFVDGGLAERRPIQIGATSLDAVELTAGAQVGDAIVIAGADGFANAPRVRLAN